MKRGNDALEKGVERVRPRRRALFDLENTPGILSGILRGPNARATLRALAPALRSGDGQAACFAAAAARACLAEGSPRTNAALLKEGFVEGALFLLMSPEKGWCAEEKSRDSDSRRGVGSASDASSETPRKRNASKRDDGARLCALRLLLAFASSGDDAIRRAVAVKGATVLGEFAAGAKRGARADAGLREKASAVLTELGL